MYDHKPSSLHDTRPPGDYPKSITAVLLYSTTLTIILLASLTAKVLAAPIQAQVLHNPVVVPSASPSASLIPSPTPSAAPAMPAAPAASEDLIAQRENIRKYIYTIFGANGSTAYAIALAESGRNSNGERVFRVDAVHRSDAEISVGLFQINLKSAETKVHYDRIPGTTTAEKIDWLKNPYNNTLFAYWVFTTSGFFPWSVYSDSTYLAYMK